MIIRGKLLGIGALGALAGLGALGLTLYLADDKIEANPHLHISSHAKSKSGESSSSLSNSDPIEKASTLSGSNDPRRARVDAFGNREGVELKSTGQSSARTVDSHQADGQSSESALPSEASAYYSHMPLAFMNYEGVLPATEQVAAAVQNLQQDFIKATGATTTANPADPNYEQVWEWAQPTADEEFYALFGIEAFNALSIMEAYQHGHF